MTAVSEYKPSDFSVGLAAKLCTAFANEGGTPTEMNVLAESPDLINKVRKILFHPAKLEEQAVAAGQDEGKLAELLKTPVDMFELSIRAINSLRSVNVTTLGDLVRKRISRLTNGDISKKVLYEMAQFVDKEGLNFEMTIMGDDKRQRVIDWGTPLSREAIEALSDGPLDE